METPKLKALIYGDSGSGKTYLCGTFTQCEVSSPVLVLNSRGQPVTFQLFEDPPCVHEVVSMSDYNGAYSWLLHGQPWGAIRGGVNQATTDRFCATVWNYMARREDLSIEVMDNDDCPVPKFKTLVIDSLTQTQRISLREITGDINKRPGDIPSATTFTHWNKTLGQLTLLADLFYKLDMHVLITALRRHQFVESQGITMFYPYFWGQSAYELPSYAELLGMLVPIASLPVQQAMQLRETELPEGEQPYNALVLRGSRTHNAKWQGVKHPPEVIVNPTAQALLDILYRNSVRSST